MRLGKMVESGPARAVLDDPRHAYSRLLKSPVLPPEVPPNGAVFHA
jgi:ABC-type phosphonate transport system ATPase subunit